MAKCGDMNLIILKVGQSHLVKQKGYNLNKRARMDVKGFCYTRPIRIQKS